MKKQHMIKISVLALLVSIAPLLSYAWGAKGHRAIGRIAEKHLNKKALAEVRRLLGDESMAMVGTWADEVIRTEKYKDSQPWHYINIPKGLDRGGVHAFLAENREKKTAYSGIQEMVTILKDKSKSSDERADALKFLIHIVGDMHQPMHCGRLEDRGGNDIPVLWRRDSTNLHAIWDSQVIDGIGLSFSEMAEEYDRLDRGSIREMQRASIEDWFYSSYQISERIYGEIEANPSATQNTYMYVRQHRDDIKVAIRNAGYRLAGLLNYIL
ncbi:S1/P1 nuclease [Sphingobacterium haloxyli]|uniref:S1/P1 Nuclease n=1 Tax=Sphingobacterium haloxyli TaxID=2100533 RepID=A0A2S9J130_9SPHI|nr:S1/P1 nuclease [Sphingobacterium haloxyli]PRD46482.1 hypothetical protein C5745_15055 [Sphingobacterium haloxyli]